MFQVFSRWMLFDPIKLCSTEWCFILQTTFFTTFQGERKLHPCTQVCLHEAPNNTCSRFLKTSPLWYFLYLFGIDLLLSVFSCLFSFVTARGFAIHKPSGTKISAILSTLIVVCLYYSWDVLSPEFSMSRFGSSFTFSLLHHLLAVQMMNSMVNLLLLNCNEAIKLFESTSFFCLCGCYGIPNLP